MKYLLSFHFPQYKIKCKEYREENFKMICLYFKNQTPQVTEIIEKLTEMSLAFEVKASLPASQPLPSGSLPEDFVLLDDNGEIVSGYEAILKHLEGLEAFKREWDKFQSDSCYCDEEGNIE